MRNDTVSHSHQSWTAKMGGDVMSVVIQHLQVYGINRLRIADASICHASRLPHCAVIGNNSRIMAFTKDGKFVTRLLVAAPATANCQSSRKTRSRGGRLTDQANVELICH